MKWIPIEYFRDFQIHYSNTLFEEVMSSSLHDLNWMNLNSKAKGKVILFPLIPSSKKMFSFFSSNFHSIQSHNQTIIHSIHLFNIPNFGMLHRNR